MSIFGQLFKDLEKYADQAGQKQKELERFIESTESQTEEEASESEAGLLSYLDTATSELEGKVRNLHNYATNSLSFSNLLETCFALYEQNQRHTEVLEPLLESKYQYNKTSGNKSISDASSSEISENSSRMPNSIRGSSALVGSAQVLLTPQINKSSTKTLSQRLGAQKESTEEENMCPPTPTLSDLGLSATHHKPHSNH